MFAVVAARPPLRAVVGKAQVVVEATPTLLRCAAGVDVRVTSTWQERDVITAVDQSVCINSRQRTALTIDTSTCATVRGKVEGDLIDIRGAMIEVESVRGETVRLLSEGGVASTKLVEGLEVDVSGTSITLAKLQASHANIRGDDVSIVAAYCRKLDVDATGASAVDAIQIDAAHGHVAATASNGGVSLQRCSGSCAIEAAGTISLAFDAMNGDAVASSDRGDVDVSVAPSIECDVELEGRHVDCAGAPMLRREVDEAGRVQGALEAKREPSRAGAGKVNVDGASQQKWDSSFISDEGGRPRIVARAPKGRVALRALSWIDAIRRKVGLPEGFEKVRRSSSSSSS
ncbi:unnamed protein product [Pelagomonas calceolata]|uniref:Adhesin domain-containing protein n=1 Tax=Pelagomonas calceolata TaxID=35677 RepID=A0A8J2S6C1_9STRA|nr:unnamed protein product [Pelagomonas calceolata]